jgi:hypothetical protein
MNEKYEKKLNIKEFNIIYQIMKSKKPNEPLDVKEFDIIYRIMDKKEPLD